MAKLGYFVGAKIPGKWKPREKERGLMVSKIIKKHDLISSVMWKLVIQEESERVLAVGVLDRPGRAEVPGGGGHS